ncbi:hypothetical protein V2J09_007824 [Rumex salicifolius]
MDSSMKLVMFCYVFTCFILLSSPIIQARSIHHHQHKPKSHSRISVPPALAPAYPDPPPPIQYPAFPPSSSWTSSPPSPRVFNVLSYGAVGDGSTDDTSAFKSAWDEACDETEPSMVQGTLVPPDGPDSWPRNSNKRQWLIFYRTHGLTMQGGGLIDGRGEKWWNLPCKPHKGINGTTLPGPCDSPVAIRFFGGTNLTLQSLKFINSPEFHIRFDNCQTVHVDSLVIKSPGNSPNTDGIHVENTVDVTIHNSVISNGDDCVSIGAGTHNMEIKNLTCGPSHGISIGSLGVHNSKACVSNITVESATIRHSDNGVRIKTWQGGSGSVSNVAFNNIHMDTVKNPIMIDQYYCLTKTCRNMTSAVMISDVSYSNIHGTYDTRAPPVHLACSDAVPCTNLTLSNVELTPAIDQDVEGKVQHKWLPPFCWSAYGTLGVDSVVLPPVYCLLEGMPFSLPLYDVGQC